MRACVCVRVCVCMRACMHVCVLCVRVCVCVCVRAHTCTQAHFNKGSGNPIKIYELYLVTDDAFKGNAP